MTKRFATLLLICLCLALTGCFHEHTPESMLSIGIEEHWYACDTCGKKMDVQAHSFDETGACTVCSAGFGEDDFGSKYAYAYDHQGNQILHIQYDYDGSVIDDSRYVIEYFEDGTTKSHLSYHNRILSIETHYRYCENPGDSDTYLTFVIYYNTDGSKKESLFNEYQVLKTTTYDSDGHVVKVERYEYELDANGKRLRDAVYTNDVLTSETLYFINDAIDGLPQKQIRYDENGKVIREGTFEYDEFFDLVRETYHIHGILNTVNHYSKSPDGAFYISKEEHYDDNGNIETVVYYSLDVSGHFYLSKEEVYNDRGEVIKETNFDPFGNIVP
jgi:hypothetical protein